MFKKAISLIVAVSMLAAMWIVPASAEAATNCDDTTLYFGVDFNNADDLAANVVDEAGNYTFQDLESALTAEDMVIEYDEEIGRNVLVLAQDGALIWRSNDGTSINGYDMAGGLTMEAYVYMDDGLDTHMMIIETNDGALHLQEYNIDPDICAGFRAGDMFVGNYVQADAYIESTFPHMEWTHIIGTSDGTVNELYINGLKVATLERNQSLLKSRSNEGDNGIYIGESYLGAMWGTTAFSGKIAFTKIYKAYADVAEAGRLYEAATGKVAPTQMPTEEPVITEEPIATPAPSHVPTDLHFAVNFDNMDAVDEAGNYTFQDLESAMAVADMTFEYDAEIGQNVLVMDGEGVLCWRSNDGSSLNGRDLSQAGVTLEAIVYLTTDPETFRENMVIIETNDGALHFQEYNDQVDLISGLRAGDLTMDGSYDMANAYIESTFPHMQWIHLIGSVSAEKNDMYINGELVASVDRLQNYLVSRYNQGDNGIYVGESYLGSMWGATAFYGKIAKVAIYNESVCAEQVATIWAESPANPENEPDVNPDPVVGWNKLIIPEMTTYADFLASNPDFKYFNIEVLKKGVQIADTAYMGTGYDLIITSKATGEVVYQDYVIVYGDISGDGKVLSADYTQAKRGVTKPLTGAKLTAGDLNMNGVIQSNDYLKIKRHFGGTYNIYNNIKFK